MTLLEESWLEKTCRQHLHSIRGAARLALSVAERHIDELQQVDQIINAELFALAGLDAKHLQLLVQAARGGGAVYFTAAYCPFSHHGFQGSDDALRYIAEHDDALAFAYINRQMIALRIMQQVKATGSPVLDWRITLLARVKSAIKGLCIVKVPRRMTTVW